MMLRRFIISCSMIATLAFAIYAQTPAAPPPAQPAKPVEEPLPAMSVPQTYRFQTRGRRDPFVNPVPKPVAPVAPVPLERPKGSKGVLLSEAKILGVVYSSQAPDMTRAMISSNGGVTYFLRKGDELFDAVVKDIQRDGVVFELSIKDRDGKTATREVVRKLTPTP
jgi:Tfp pilus assembly protein PilP